MGGTFADKQKERGQNNGIDHCCFKKKRPGHRALDSVNNQRSPPPNPHHYPPNCIVFLANLPEETHGMMLSAAKFSGFKEIGFLLGKHDTAFIEFENGTWAREARWAG